MGDSISTALNRISELNNRRAELFKEGLRDISIKIFSNYPLVSSMGWLGYAPYFNDSEPCVPYYTLKGNEETDSSKHGIWGTVDGMPELSEFRELIDSCSDLIDAEYDNNHEVNITRHGDSIKIEVQKFRRPRLIKGVFI